MTICTGEIKIAIEIQLVTEACCLANYSRISFCAGALIANFFSSFIEI